MKRLLLIAFLLPVISISCSKDKTAEPGGNATIVIRSEINKGVDEISRSDEVDSYWLTVTGPGGFDPIARILGSQWTISDLEYGEYTVTLVSQQNYTLPAYNTPIYKGTATKPLHSSTPTPFDIKCTQANVGIQFIFDKSVTTCYTAPVATITDSGSGFLTLSPDDYGSRIAYFDAPGDLTITLKDGEAPIQIGGKDSQTITVSPRELWTITLKTSNTAGKGGIEMGVSIDKGTTPQEPEFGVGGVTGKGTAEYPFSVGGAINTMPANGVWVEGYIVDDTALTRTTESKDNIILGLKPDSPIGESIVVELPEGKIRNALNIVDNPENIGMRIALKGNVAGQANNFTSGAFATITGVTDFAMNYFTSMESINYYYKNQGKVLKNSANFPIGAAVRLDELNNNPTYVQILKRDFNSITAEHSMKMGTIWSSGRNTYNYADADAIVAFAKANGMRVHGHALIWSHDDEIPGWMKTLDLNKDEWTALMKEYITEVVTHYAGKVDSWDVVNEAFNEDGTLRGANSGDQYTFWYEKVGPDFIKIAFETARAALNTANDTKCKLFYNDYNYIKESKRAGIFAHIKTLQEASVPIDGVGMQLHSDVYPDVAGMKAAFKKADSMRLMVHASEFDALINNPTYIGLAKKEKWITGDYITFEDMYGDVTKSFNFDYGQGKSYNMFARAYLTHVPKDLQFGISIWGVTDKTAFARNGSHHGFPDFPLMFGDYGNAKRAYHGLLEGLNGTDWDDLEKKNPNNWGWRWNGNPGGYEPQSPWGN